MNLKKILLGIMTILLFLIAGTSLINVFFPSQDRVSVQYFKKDFGNEIEDYIDTLNKYSETGDKKTLEKAKKQGINIMTAIQTFNGCQPLKHKTYYQFQWLQKETEEMSEYIDKAYTLAANKNEQYKKYTKQIIDMKKSIVKDAKQIDSDLSYDVSFYFLALLVVGSFYVYRFEYSKK